MPDPKRLEFVTRHFKDLQTIRFAPVPALMLLAPFAPAPPPHVSKGVALAVILALAGFLLCVIGFYWWSTVAIKRRYGSVKLSGDEARRMQNHPVIFVLRIAPLLGIAAVPRRYFWDWYFPFIVLIQMLTTILDSSNLAIRRVVWAIGLVVLFATGPFLVLNDVDDGAAIIFLGGVVWLSISVFDFLLLRRTFTEISASPSAGATDAVAQYG